MDITSWKKLLIQWVNSTELIGKSVPSIEQTDIDAFFIEYKALITSCPIPEDNIVQFIQTNYPDFQLHFFDHDNLCSADYVYIYSLLLHFSCVQCREEYFHKTCITLSSQYQSAIANFFSTLMGNPSINRNLIKIAISDAAPKSPLQFMPMDSPIRTPREKWSPTTPRINMLEERTKELKLLKVQLETERYEKSFLEVQLKQNEEKIEKLIQQQKNHIAENNYLKNQLISEDRENLSPNKNFKDEQCKKRLQKEILEKEESISKLQNDIDNLIDDKMSLQNRLLIAERQAITLIEKSKENEITIEDMKADLERKVDLVAYLQETNMELQTFIHESRNPDKLNTSDCLDFSFNRSSTSSNSSSSPENLGRSVVDVQLREKEMENLSLKNNLKDIQDENLKFSQQIVELLTKNSQIFDNIQDVPKLVTDDTLSYIMFVFLCSVEKLIGNHSAAKQEITDMTSMNKFLNDQIVELHQNLNSLESKNKLFINQIVDLNEKLNESVESLAHVKSCNETLLLQLDDLKQNCNDLKVENDGLKIDKNSYKITIDHLENELSIKAVDIKELINKNEKSASDIQKLMYELENCNVAITDLQSIATDSEYKLQQLENEKTDLLSEKKFLAIGLDEITHKYSVAEEKCVQLEGVIENFKSEMITLNTEIKRLKDLCKENNEKLEQSEIKFNDFQTENLKLQSAIAGLQLDINHVTLSYQLASKEIDELKGIVAQKDIEIVEFKNIQHQYKLNQVLEQEQIQEKLKESQFELEIVNKNLSDALTNESELNCKIGLFENKLKELEVVEINMREENSKLSLQIKELIFGNDQLQGKVDEYEKEELILAQQLDNINEKVIECEKEIKDLNKIKQNLLNVKSEKDNKIINFEINVENLTEQIKTLESVIQGYKTSETTLLTEKYNLDRIIVELEKSKDTVIKEFQGNLVEREQEFCAEEKQFVDIKSQLETEVTELKGKLLKQSEDLVAIQETNICLEATLNELLAEKTNIEANNTNYKNNLEMTLKKLSDTGDQLKSMTDLKFDLDLKLLEILQENQLITKNKTELSEMNIQQQVELENLKEQVIVLDQEKSNLKLSSELMIDENNLLKSKLEIANSKTNNLETECQKEMKIIEELRQDAVKEKQKNEEKITKMVAHLESSNDELKTVYDVLKAKSELMTEEKQSLLKEIDDLKIAKENIESLLSDKDSEWRKLEDQLKEEQLEVIELKTKNDDFLKINEEIIAEWQALKLEKEMLIQDQQILRSEINDLKAHLKQSVTKSKELSTDCSAAYQRIDKMDVELKSVEEERKNVNNRLVEQQSEMEKILEVKEQLTAKVEELKTKETQMQEIISSAKEELVALKNESENTVLKLQSELEASSNLVSKLTSQNSKVENQLQQLEDKLTESLTKHVEFEQEITSSKQKIADLENTNQEILTNLNSVQLVALNKEILEKEMKELKDNYENTIEKYDQLSLEYRETTERALQLQDKLKLTEEEREMLKNCLEEQKSEFVISKNMEKQLIEKIDELTNKEADMKNNLLDIQNISEERVAKIQTEKDNTIKKLENDLVASSNLVTKLSTQNGTIEEELSKLQSKMAETGTQNAELLKIRDNFEELRLDHKELIEKNKITDTKLIELTTEILSKDEKISQLLNQLHMNEKNQTDDENKKITILLQQLEKYKADEKKLHELELLHKKEKEINEKLTQDISIFQAKLYKNRQILEDKEKTWLADKEQMEKQMVEDRNAEAKRIKENRLDLEAKLDKMKEKMKTLFNEEMAKVKARHDKEIFELKTDITMRSKKLEEYEMQTRKLSNQILHLNEKQLEFYKENEFMKNKIKMMETHPGLTRKYQMVAPPLSSISSSMTSLTAKGSQQILVGTGSLKMEDEEGELFNNTYLMDLKTGGRISPNGRDSVRLSELQHRNSMQPRHLRSTYAAQYGDQDYREDDIMNNIVGSHLDDSLSSLLCTGQRKKISGTTSYKKPGPPTPSKNAGRLSFGGNEIHPREILREANDNVIDTVSSTVKKTTPGKLKSFFGGGSNTSKLKDEDLFLMRQKVQKASTSGTTALFTSTPRKRLSKANRLSRQLRRESLLNVIETVQWSSDCDKFNNEFNNSDCKLMENLENVFDPHEALGDDSNSTSTTSQSDDQRKGNNHKPRKRRLSLNIWKIKEHKYGSSIKNRQIIRKKSKVQRTNIFDECRDSLMNQLGSPLVENTIGYEENDNDATIISPNDKFEALLLRKVSKSPFEETENESLNRPLASLEILYTNNARDDSICGIYANRFRNKIPHLESQKMSLLQRSMVPSKSHFLRRHCQTILRTLLIIFLIVFFFRFLVDFFN